MTEHAKQIQAEIDPRSGARVVDKYTFPFALKDSKHLTHLVLSETKEIQICYWDLCRATGFEKMVKGESNEIPVSDVIRELEYILAELKAVQAQKNIDDEENIITEYRSFFESSVKITHDWRDEMLNKHGHEAEEFNG